MLFSLLLEKGYIVYFPFILASYFDYLIASSWEMSLFLDFD